MKKLVLVCALVVLAVGPLGAADDMPAMTIHTPETLQWQEAPSALPRGAKMAVLRGDPAKEGLFIIRLKAPANYTVPPHWHPAAENVTVLSGKLHFSMGDVIDKAKPRTVPAGGFAMMPPMVRHAAWTEGETEFEIAAMGPWQLYYVNPKDDPRNALTSK